MQWLKRRGKPETDSSDGATPLAENAACTQCSRLPLPVSIFAESGSVDENELEHCWHEYVRARNSRVKDAIVQSLHPLLRAVSSESVGYRSELESPLLSMEPAERNTPHHSLGHRYDIPYCITEAFVDVASSFPSVYARRDHGELKAVRRLLSYVTAMLHALVALSRLPHDRLVLYHHGAATSALRFLRFVSDVVTRRTRQTQPTQSQQKAQSSPAHDDPSKIQALQHAIDADMHVCVIAALHLIENLLDINHTFRATMRGESHPSCVAHQQRPSATATSSLSTPDTLTSTTTSTTSAGSTSTLSFSSTTPLSVPHPTPPSSVASATPPELPSSLSFFWRRPVESPHSMQAAAAAAASTTVADIALRSDALEVLTHVLKALQRARINNTLPAPLQIIQVKALWCVGASLSCRSSVICDRAREYGTLEALSGLIGWNATLRPARERSMGGDGYATAQGLRDEFHLQLIAFRALLCALDGSAVSIDRFQRSGAATRLCDLFLWVARRASDFPPPLGSTGTYEGIAPTLLCTSLIQSDTSRTPTIIIDLRSEPGACFGGAPSDPVGQGASSTGADDTLVIEHEPSPRVVLPDEPMNGSHELDILFRATGDALVQAFAPTPLPTTSTPATTASPSSTSTTSSNTPDMPKEYTADSSSNSHDTAFAAPPRNRPLAALLLGVVLDAFNELIRPEGDNDDARTFIMEHDSRAQCFFVAMLDQLLHAEQIDSSLVLAEFERAHWLETLLSAPFGGNSVDACLALRLEATASETHESVRTRERVIAEKRRKIWTNLGAKGSISGGVTGEYDDQDDTDMDPSITNNSAAVFDDDTDTDESRRSQQNNGDDRVPIVHTSSNTALRRSSSSKFVIIRDGTNFLEPDGEEDVIGDDDDDDADDDDDDDDDDGSASPTSKPSNDQDNVSRPLSISDATRHGHAHDALQAVRTSVMRCVIRIAVNPHLSPVTTISLLLQSLALHAYRPPVVHAVARKILLLLALRPAVCKDALLKLKCLSTLTPIARDCTSTMSADARVAVLSLLGMYVIGNPGGVLDVFLNNPALKLLVSYLASKRAPPVVWHWSLRVIVHIVRTVPVASSGRMVTLLNMFLKVFVSSPTEDFAVSVRLLMLQSIRAMLAGETRARLQESFIGAGSFVKIVNVVVAHPTDGAPGLPLCKEVVRTLTSLMAGSNRCKEKFRAHVGFPHLGRCMLLATNNEVDRRLMLLLLDMAVDGEYVEKGVNVIQNANAIILALDMMFQRLSSDDRVWFCRVLMRLCDEGYANRTRCCDAGVLGILLRKLPSLALEDPVAFEEIVCLVELLGAHSVSAAELKQLCRLFRASRDRRRPAEAPRMLKAVQRMCVRSGPLFFFDFPREIRSGIVVPPCDRRAGNANGYTFCAWLRFESFGNDNRFYSLSAGLSQVDPARTLLSDSDLHNPNDNIPLDDASLMASSRQRGASTASDVGSFGGGGGGGGSSSSTSESRVHSTSVSAGSSSTTPGSGGLSAEAMRFKNKKPPHRSGIDEPTLFSMVSSTGESCTVSVTGRGEMVLSAVVAGTEHSCVFERHRFKRNEWYHVVFTHSAARRPFAKAEAHLFVNGRPVDAVHMPHPSLSGSIPDMYLASGLWGQMGAVYLLSDAVGASQAADLYALGPQYTGQFQESDALNYPRAAASLFDGSLSNRIWLNYNARACKGRVCLDLALRNPKARQLNALLYGHQCVTTSIKDVFRSLGGAQLLFVLLPQVDFPEFPGLYSDDMEALAKAAKAKKAQSNRLDQSTHDLATSDVYADAADDVNTTENVNATDNDNDGDDDDDNADDEEETVPELSAEQECEYEKDSANANSDEDSDEDAIVHELTAEEEHDMAPLLAIDEEDEQTLAEAGQEVAENARALSAPDTAASHAPLVLVAQSLPSLVPSTTVDTPDVTHRLHTGVIVSSEGNTLLMSIQSRQAILVTQFFATLRDLIATDADNELGMLKCHGMAVTAWLLQRLRSACITIEALHVIHELTDAIQNEALQHETIKYLLFDFHVWERCDFATQMTHMQLLSAFIKNDLEGGVERTRQLYGPTFFVHILDAHHWYSTSLLTRQAPTTTHTPDTTTSLSKTHGGTKTTAPPPAPAAKKVSAEGRRRWRLTVEERRGVRACALEIIRQYLLRAIRQPEINAIVSFLAACRDYEQVFELLRFCCDSLNISGFADAFCLAGGGDLCATLLACPSEQVRLTAMRTMMAFLTSGHIGERLRKRFRLDDATEAGLLRRMMNKELSVKMTRALFEYACDGRGDNILRNSYVVSAIVVLMRTGEPALRCRGVTKIRDSMRSSASSGLVLRSSLAWSSQLLALLYDQPVVPLRPRVLLKEWNAACASAGDVQGDGLQSVQMLNLGELISDRPNPLDADLEAATRAAAGAPKSKLPSHSSTSSSTPTSPSATPSLAAARALVCAVLDCVSEALRAGFHTDKKTWKAFEDAMRFVDVLYPAEEHRLFRDWIQRGLLGRALSQCLHDVQLCRDRHKPPPVLATTAAHLILLTEEFVFYQPSAGMIKGAATGGASTAVSLGALNVLGMPVTDGNAASSTAHDDSDDSDDGEKPPPSPVAAKQDLIRGASSVGSLGSHGGASSSMAYLDVRVRPFELLLSGVVDGDEASARGGDKKKKRASKDKESGEPQLEWPDAALCVALIRLTDTLGRTFSSSFSGLDPVLGGRSHVRVEGGGISRVTLRCLSQLLFCSEASLCQFALDRLVQHVCSDGQTVPRITWALWYMDRAARANRGTRTVLVQAIQYVLRTWHETLPYMQAGASMLCPLSALEESNREALSSLMSSPTWALRVASELEPLKQSVEVGDYESAGHAEFLSKRFGRRLSKARATVARLRRNEEALLKRAQERVISVVQTKAQTETSHTLLARRQRDAERRLLQAQWDEDVAFMVGERGALATTWRPRNGWVLDATETSGRMRRKLSRTLLFNGHREASVARDSGRAATGEQQEMSLAGIVPKAAKRAMQSASEGADANDEMLEAMDLEHVDGDGNVTVGTGAAGVGEASGTEGDWTMVDNELLLQMGSNVQLVHVCDCQLVTLMSIVPGRLELMSSGVRFTADREGGRDESNIVTAVDRRVWDFHWVLAEIREVHLRRHMLRPSALEVFLIDRTNCFLNFTRTERTRVYSKLLSLRPPNLVQTAIRSPAEMLRKSGLTQRWQRREISNFDYLMQLNTIAGRTYNDLNQYPVFPWVLADYTSEKLDLSDPRVYRDLSKPVGALNPERLEYFVERYHSFEDPSGVVDKFHYGSHYSTAAAVLHFLVRLEPFTTLHIRLQGGRFDHADRQFISMAQSWNSCMTSTTDVKELVPEFYYCPEFLQNLNQLDLGVLQGDEEQRVDDVVLPPWAKGPEDFVRVMRAALESEFVSANLHHWIDLIFGVKQRGPEAVAAHNVFYYVTYEGAIDIDSVTDEVERRSIEAQINNFGQTPTQLLKRSHPQRYMPQPDPRVGLELVPFVESGITGVVPQAYAGRGPAVRNAKSSEPTTSAATDLASSSGGGGGGGGGGVLADSAVSSALTFGHTHAVVAGGFTVSSGSVVSVAGTSSGGGGGGGAGGAGAVMLGGPGGSVAAMVSGGVGSGVSGGTLAVGGGTVADCECFAHGGGGMGVTSAEGTVSVFVARETLKAFFKEVYTRPKMPVVYIGVPETQLNAFVYSGTPDRVVTVGEQGVLGCHSWVPTAPSLGAVAPFTFDLDPQLSSGFLRVIGGPFAQNLEVSSSLFCTSADGKMAVSGGHWDSTIKVTALDVGRVIQSVAMHADIVTCVCVDATHSVLVTGSRDTTAMVWQLVASPQPGSIHHIVPSPLKVLYGHDDELLCAAVDTDLDMVVTGAKDGTVIVHTCRLGRYVRTLRPPMPMGTVAPQVRFVKICQDGSLVVYVERFSYEEKGVYMICLYTINGKLIASSSCSERVLDMAVSRRGTHLVVGCSDGVVELRRLPDLSVQSSLNMQMAVHSVSLTMGDGHVLLGLRDGKVIILTVANNVI